MDAFGLLKAGATYVFRSQLIEAILAEDIATAGESHVKVLCNPNNKEE
jgi:hypothetical protein